MIMSTHRAASRRRGRAVAACLVGGAAVATTLLGQPASVAASKAPAHAVVHAPKVVGLTQSQAQCALASAHLRWRYRGDDTVHSKPIASCSGNSAVMPDPKVIAQSPKAGSHVHRGRVVVLDDECLKRARDTGMPCM